MKKCILIGALAALMLFAFTACEQPGLTLPANVDYITVVQTKDFVDGDKFSAANFTVYAHDTNGGNTPVNGAKVEIDETEATGGDKLTDGKVASGKNYVAKATLKVAGSAETITLDASCSFTAYALESYEVSGMPSLVAFVVTTEEDTKYVKAAPSDSSVTEDSVLKSVKVSGVYANGETRELSAADIKDNLYVTDAEGNKIEAAAFTVGTTYYLSVGTGTDAKLTNITVLAVEEAPVVPEKKFAGYDIVFTGKAWFGQNANWALYEKYTVGGKTTRDQNPILEASDVTTSWDSCGFAVISIDDGDSSNAAANNDAYSSTYTLFKQSVKIISKTEPSKGVYTIEIPRGENYITALPAATDVHFDSKVTALSGNMTTSQLAIEVEWAKNRTTTGTDPEYLSSGYSIVDQKYDSASGTWTALISVTLDNVKTADSPFTVGSDEVLLEVSLDKDDILSASN